MEQIADGNFPKAQKYIQCDQYCVKGQSLNRDTRFLCVHKNTSIYVGNKDRIVGGFPGMTKKKPYAKRHRESYGSPIRERQHKTGRSLTRPSIVACIKEESIYGQRVRNTSSQTASFVCQTTPHFGSTLREVSYSVPMYHTRNAPKSKYIFYFLGKFCRFPSGDLRILLIMMK